MMKTNNKLESIQILRALAAFLVVFNHVGAYVYSQMKGDSFFMSTGFVYMGGFGVHVFFCISGFIMAYSHKGDHGIRSALSFMGKRVWRIYPIYWVWTIITLFALKQQYLSDFNLLVNSLILTPDIYPNGQGRLILGQGWTLQYEMYFYLVFGLCVAFANRYLFTLISLIIVAVMIYAPSHIEGQYSFFFGNNIVLDFIMGILCAWIYRKYSHLSINNIIPVSICVLGFAASCWLTLSVGGMDRLYSMGLPAFIIVLACPFIKVKDGAFTRFLVFCGEASYTTYLCHLIFIPLVALLIPALLRLGAPVDIYMVAASLIVATLTLPAYLLLEKPIINIARKMTFSPNRMQQAA
ncbi:acyltransferase [Enterobacter sp. JMULE2]|uniref:acyltransferase family protein n=1 Tax=Enterobacter sp. JMULE2 TaxID=2518340 RepID=UPI0020C85E71|nr:acyltransferase [Enterobacter sp. JMULE2]NTZ39148.1 acyltransferase [Enterobacter sp. JMULE2]